MSLLPGAEGHDFRCFFSGLLAPQVAMTPAWPGGERMTISRRDDFGENNGRK
jgi:hypothetical protein